MAVALPCPVAVCPTCRERLVGMRHEDGSTGCRLTVKAA